MKCEVSNKIYITNPCADVISWCKNNLVLDNPEYYKKEQLGKWTGNTPKYIYLYEKKGDVLEIPFGCLQTLYHNLYHICQFKPNFSPIRGFFYQSNIKLYDYQEEAVKKALMQKNGILVMPCGSGKTQCGLEIISRVGGRALWLTHTQDLLNQSKTRALSVLDCDKAAFGTITGGKVNISNGITFATIQTMVKLDLSNYKDMWDIIIVDECQHCAGSPTKVTQFYKVVSNLSARYKIGLTATPKRADGLEKSMFTILGPKIHEVSREAVAHTTCPVKVEFISTGYEPDFDAVLAGDGTINYSALVDNMIHHVGRFEVIMNTLMFIPRNNAVMVLANRVEYLQWLCEEYKNRQIGEAVCLSAMGNSKGAKEIRKRALESLNDGELDCIFATYQLAKEGLDVPNLRYIVFATPEKDETTVIQSAGRVARKADGKEFGTVIDFQDDFGMYNGWLKKRKGYYKKLGYHYVT